MTAPAVAASRFGIALAMGAGLGLFYGFLRPLRPRLTHLADLIFVLASFYAWLHLGFGICGGDLRLAYTLGLPAGAVLWEMTAGKWLRPVFRGFWRWIGNIFLLFVRPLQKFLIFFAKKCKKLFAFRKKWVTIKGTIPNCRKMPGGSKHGTTQKEKIPSGSAKKPSGHLDLHAGSRGSVRRGADHPAGQH